MATVLSGQKSLGLSNNSNKKTPLHDHASSYSSDDDDGARTPSLRSNSSSSELMTMMRNSAAASPLRTNVPQRSPTSVSKSSSTSGGISREKRLNDSLDTVSITPKALTRNFAKVPTTTPSSKKPIAATKSDKDSSNDPNNWIQEQYEELARRLPVLKKVTENVRQIPPKYKLACFFVWILWKVVAAGLVLFVLHHQTSIGGGAAAGGVSSSDTGAMMMMMMHSSTAEQSPEPPLRILYIVTSLAEYNNGQRNTVKGQDRLAEVVLPILVDSVESMVMDPHYSHHHQVDVYLILAYTLRPEREQLIRDRLPAAVGLEIWDDACPLGYDKRSPDRLVNNTRALARQHRYVIKDKLPYYDVFVSFEDDMRISAAHVQHFVDMSNELERLKETAGGETIQKSLQDDFFGPMTSRQLDRLIPGFVRVEVLLNETENGAQKELDPIPLDYDFSGKETHFDAHPCCHVQMHTANIPAHPDTANVVVWETSVKALGVRQLPEYNKRTANLPPVQLDWVALLPGPGKRLTEADKIQSFWSGRLVGAWETKPSPGQPDLIAQQGGWMATRNQIVRLHQQDGDDVDGSTDHPQLCQGTFLPPFDEPMYRQDGQESMNVEFWSGGYQLFTGVKGGCNMVRVVSLHPDHFSKHFIYHVANNKQKQLARKRMVRADHLWAQLNTVKKAAEKEKASILEKHPELSTAR